MKKSHSIPRAGLGDNTVISDYSDVLIYATCMVLTEFNDTMHSFLQTMASNVDELNVFFFFFFAVAFFILLINLVGQFGILLSSLLPRPPEGDPDSTLLFGDAGVNWRPQLRQTSLLHVVVRG